MTKAEEQLHIMRQANDIARMNGMKKEEFKAAKQEILEKKQVVSD